MCMVSSPPKPKRPAEAPRLPDQGAVAARDEERLRRRRAFGRAATILTGASGLNSTASTTGNTLLGQ